ncbi:MAG: DUF1573 domain-containing protein [Bacteroidota bacterium]
MNQSPPSGKPQAELKKVGPAITFEETSHDFGQIKKGERKTKVFRFTSTGDEDLVLELVSGCACSDLKWPEGKSFKPGEKGEIVVTFDSNREEELGPHEKTVDVLLAHNDPKTGYQVFKELKYTLTLVE